MNSLLRSFITLWSLGTLAALGFSAVPAQAQDILRSAETIFFDARDQSRVGIEVEFVGIAFDKVPNLLAKAMGGTVEKVPFVQKTTLKETLADGTKVYNEVKGYEYVVHSPRLGDIIIKPDFNQLSDEGALDPKSAVLELVTEPIRYFGVPELQVLMNILQANGARGTGINTPVSVQVNLELGRGVRSKIRPLDVVNLVRSYMRPQHREMIKPKLRVAMSREPYVEAYSPGMMRELMDPYYQPTWREFYDDFIYRQSLELLEVRGAWTMPIEEARKKLLSMPEPIVPKVVKLNRLRISSLLMYMLPLDPMSKLYESSGWAYARPLVEFREWNNDFDVVAPTRQAIGLKIAAEKYGYYDHDRLVHELTGVDEIALKQMREWPTQHPDKPLVFRYFLGDPKTVEREEFAELAKHYEGNGIVDFLAGSSRGRKPLILPPNSVVFHRRHIHATNVLGQYNPGLTDAYLQQFLENKYVEALFWNEYAPGSMPKTVLFPDVAQAEEPLEKTVARLNELFPKGFVMKGIWDLGSEKDIVTNHTDIAKEYEAYKKSDFEKYRRKVEIEFAYLKDTTPEYLQFELKKHPNYMGFKIARLLEVPHNVIIQEMAPIDREFRVEIIGGKVLGQGSTVDRFAYLEKDAPPSPPEIIKSVEVWAQSMVDKLPEKLRGMPMGMDVATLKGGGFIMIESNVSGNSGFLSEEGAQSIEALARYLEAYPALAKSGKAPKDLSPIEQMEFIRGKIKQYKINVQEQYPGIRFLADRIEDPEFPMREPNEKYYRVRASEAKLPLKAFVERHQTPIECLKNALAQ